jgi:sedoheptulose-bisphosphatase
VSPRTRAQKTFELLFASSETKPPLVVDERVREWTYGDYEGFYKHEAVASRKAKGLPSGEGGWNIWIDGCEGGESAEDMTARVDTVVLAVREAHRRWCDEPGRQVGDKGGDVLIVSHGHFSVRIYRHIIESIS